MTLDPLDNILNVEPKTKATSEQDRAGRPRQEDKPRPTQKTERAAHFLELAEVEI
jgi:hypothetical protein